MDRLKELVTVSERLTGHSHTELLGTGSAEEHLVTLQQAVPEPLLEDLLATAYELDGDDATAALLADPRLGPVARNIILLWYCGTWEQLDRNWRREHGAPALESHVVSANAYLSGLQWTVAGAHAAGGNQQGFGAWAQQPEGAEGLGPEGAEAAAHDGVGS